MTLSLADRTKVINVFNTIGDLQLTPKHIYAAASASANMTAVLKYIYQQYKIDTNDFMSQNLITPSTEQKNQKFIARSIHELNDNYEWGITPDLISQQASKSKTLSQALASLGFDLNPEHNFPILAYDFKRLSPEEARFAREMYQPFQLSPTAKKMEHRAFDCGYAYRGHIADPALGEIALNHESDIPALSYAQAITTALNANHYAQLHSQCKNGTFTQNQFILAILEVDALSVLFRVSVALELKLCPLETICENLAYIKIARRQDLTEQEKVLMIKVEMIDPVYAFYEDQYKKHFTPNSWNVPRP